MRASCAIAGVVIGLLAVSVCPSRADALTIDFETFAELEAVTSQVSGLTFANATVLTAGSFLNELDFPPRSGSNVVFDDGGVMRIDFLAPIASFGGYFNYAVPIVLTAFDASNTLLGTRPSAFLSNLGTAGDPGSSTNEFLEVAFGGMAYVTIAGDPGGGSFTGDDFTITAPTPVPEPGTIGLLLLGLPFSVRRVRRLMRRDF